jgi:hypothetical protein
MAQSDRTLQSLAKSEKAEEWRAKLLQTEAVEE